MASFYYADGPNQRGPFEIEQLRGQAIHPETLVWSEGMAQWERADAVPELATLFGGASVASAASPPPMPPAGGGGGAFQGQGHVPPYLQKQVESNRVAAGVFGILLGGLGIHKFMLGMTTPGLIMLLSSILTCGVAAPIMHVIGLVEGIIYLTKTDEEFHQIYVVGKKGWF